MDQIWQEAAKQIPNLVVLVALVIIFLKHLTNMTEGFERMLKDIGSSCHDFQERVSAESNAQIARNTLALDRNSEALGYSSKNGPRV
jgi:hypothetical protein